MSVLKSELKQLITHEIGVRVEDAMEAAKKELSLLEGKQTAFLDGSKAIEALMVSVDKDVTEEKYGIETAEVVKRYLLRGFHALQNLSTQATQHRLAQMGKVQGFDHTVKLLANMVEQEKAKIAALQVAETESAPASPRERLVGLRPVSIKAQRLAEEAEQQAVAGSSAEPLPGSLPEPPPESPSELVKLEAQAESAPVKTPEAEEEEEAASRTPRKQRGRKRAGNA